MEDENSLKDSKEKQPKEQEEDPGERSQEAKGGGFPKGGSF